MERKIEEPLYNEPLYNEETCNQMVKNSPNLNSEKKDLWIAMLMNAIPVNEQTNEKILASDTYKFEPIYVMEGNCLPNDLAFFDIYDNVFFSIMDTQKHIKKGSIFYAFPIHISELKETYNVQTEEEAKEIYNKILNDRRYIGRLNNQTNQIELEIREKGTNKLVDSQKEKTKTLQK